MFAVFIIKNGKWSMHADGFMTIKSAKIEADYINSSIGVSAKVFKKV